MNRLGLSTLNVSRAAIRSASVTRCLSSSAALANIAPRVQTSRSYWTAAPSVNPIVEASRKSVCVHRALSHKKMVFRTFSSLPSHQKISMPALSPTMEKGNIVSWSKKEGDAIAAGDMLGEIETDKSIIAFEASEDGYLAKIIVPAGTQGVPIGTPIAIVVENKDDISKFKDYSGDAAAPAAPKAAPQPKPAEAPAQPAATPEPTPQATQQQPQQPQQTQPQQQSQGRVFASPAARAAAAATGIELGSVEGTGPNGRVIKADVVEKAAQQPAATKAAPQQAAQQPAFQAPKAVPPVATASYTDIPNSNIRKVIASRLTASKQTIPHYYLTIEANVDELLKIRTDLNNKANGEYKLSVNDFIVKAAAAALRKVPEANSSWSEEAIRRYHTVDINVAVNTDNGLFTPLIANADQKGLATIANSVKELAEKAKGGKLTPTDLTIGTFTISNLGMFGIKHFAAVINPPQACILAVGGTEKKVVVKGTNAAGEPIFGVSNVMSVTLSCDHRVVDGAIGAKWLQAFKNVLEDPIKLLL
eukprot:TRINITY_DN446_c0_g4_i1.p1 TRINITY_DN446_c0_g4~~TRINITY_DN446_c0_g4_i1.p1  ORF type:complete len:532 (+),score=169.30 TRINITY_DN446_c0_g4_i1:215-1810(+)